MMKQTYKPLFEPFTFESGVTIPNRISVAPMTHYSSNDDGTISDRELSYITPRSKEMGMVITACANVTPDGKAFPGQPGIYDDSHIPGLKTRSGDPVSRSESRCADSPRRIGMPS